MTQTVEAIYENGVLRPVQPLDGIADQSRVRVTVEPPSATHPRASAPELVAEGGVLVVSGVPDCDLTQVVELERERRLESVARSPER